MSRAALSKTKNIIISAAAAVVIIGIGTWAYIANSPDYKVTTLTNAQHQITQISYEGQQGVTVMALLKEHARVQTKQYSFGEEVTSINGTAGTGPKYWIFYVDGKEASKGASVYVTKNSDTITWKLQS